ncbi:hypothetical protein [Roseobacter sp.]|uniref:hypothetical protein n=1 Tax=Roseobacter sp. TaxID=1907202 RepID=UPI00385B9CB2
MPGNEIDTHATLNELKAPRAYDGGREAVLVGFLTFVGLIVFFKTASTSLIPSIVRSFICVVVPLGFSFATWKWMATQRKLRAAQGAEGRRQANLERAAQQIAEARARGDFDRWKTDK